MKCKVCNDETNQIKAGKTKAGTEKYKCKICGKYYAPEGKKREYSEEIKNQAIKLYMEGNSGRSVGRILGIGKNMCLYWVRKYAKEIEPKETPNARVNVIEIRRAPILSLAILVFPRKLRLRMCLEHSIEMCAPSLLANWLENYEGNH